MGWLYLVEYEGYYKIGLTTTTVEIRIKGFQTPTPVRIVDRIEVDNYLLKTAESNIHRALKAFNYRNEWFSFEDDTQAIKLFHLAYEYGDDLNDNFNKSLIYSGRFKKDEKEYVVGGKTFKSKGELLLYVREIHAKEVLSTEDKQFILNLLTHHRNYLLKAGIGITDIGFGSGDFNTKCFIVIRKNGTTESFSYYTCVNDVVATPKLQVVKPIKVPNSKFQHVSNITDTTQFWKEYNAAKITHAKQWSKVKKYYEVNPIFIKWKVRRGI